MSAQKMLVAAMVALFGFSCGGPSQMNEASGPDESAQVSQNQSAPKIYGTFVAQSASAGQLTRMVLFTDGRFHAEQSVVCFTTPCEPMVIEGNYKFHVMNGIDVMGLTDSSGAHVDNLEYVYNRPVLSIRPSSGAPLQEMTRGAAWCAAASDCKLQKLYTPAAEGAWHCESNLCNFHLKSEATE